MSAGFTIPSQENTTIVHTTEILLSKIRKTETYLSVMKTLESYTVFNCQNNKGVAMGGDLRKESKVAGWITCHGWKK